MNDDIDITSDLGGGPGDAALGDNLPQNAGADGQLNIPDGAIQQNANLPPADTKVPDDKGNKPEPSLRDTLSNAFKGTDDKPADQQTAATADKPQLTKDADGKYRQADGTFASAEQIAAFEASANAQPQDNQQQQAAPTINGLTPVEQQQFQSLPAELRQFVERTMEGLNTRGARYNEYDLLEQHLIGPRRQAWAQQGMNPVAAINQLFALSDFASTRPGDFVLWFAQSNGLDLDQLLDERDAQQSSDPQVQALQNTVQQLQGVVNNFHNGQQQAAQSARLQEVQTFAAEKDGSGALLRPYLTDVQDTWPAHITAILNANPGMNSRDVLQRAYEAACWANPNVRAKMQQATEAARRAEEQRKVQAARNAGSSVTGAPNGSQPSNVNQNSNLSLRDELEQQFAAARAS